MKKKEYLEKITKVKIDNAKVSKVQECYGCNLPETIQKIVSDNDEAIFLDDDVRILSLNEIIDAENDLHVDFINKGLVPLVDCGENDFIVYNFEEKVWSMFNIVDEIVFKQKNDLGDLLR